MDEVVLPWSYRKEKRRGNNNLIVLGLIEAAERRTRRLLRSFNELEREAWGTTSRANDSTSKFKIDPEPNWSSLISFGDEWWNHWASSLEKARGVRVPKDHLSREFRKARRIGLECDPKDEKRWRIVFDTRNWAYYKLNCRSRHKWGQYLRSCMDWDWRLGTCLKRLFKVEKKAGSGTAQVAQSKPVAGPAIDVATGSGGTLETSMGHDRDQVALKETQLEVVETQNMSIL